MSTVTGNGNGTNDGGGIEIVPGAVVVDLNAVDLDTLSADDLRDAFEESEAQERDGELDAEDLLGDLDLNPL